MGATGSTSPQSCAARLGGQAAQAQHTFTGSSYSQHSYGWDAKLSSLDQSGERPADRKKKSLGLATLKRRFIKRRKSSRSADHARQLRELLSGWDVRDASALVEEYEGTAALKELSFHAGLARAEAPSLHRDLASLYQHKYCTDVDLMFRDACFPAHRAILAARCPFFKTLLSASPGYGAEVLMDIETAGIDVPMFSALLQYLYTGELGGGAEDARLQNVEVLMQLSEEFGTPNTLEDDMRSLSDYMCYYDALLSFSSDAELVESYNEGGGGRGGGGEGEGGGGVVMAAGGGGGGPTSSNEDLRAHKAVLSARSPFFRNLLQRRIRTGEEMTERALQKATRIVLDESIIPRKYVKVILHCMYTDMVDLGLVLGGLGEVQGMGPGGRGASPRTEEAMELYHIALFLEFGMLAQGCEDLIVDSLSLDSLEATLRWSSQPYGSKWVHRQAVHFLCEEFSQVITSDVLYELSKEHLLSAMRSDYLQASEQDILKYVVKWGEQQLIKRMADREPNLLSGTAHSVNKRGVKRRDLDVEELKDILSPLLPLVRSQHILPTSSDVLADAMKRGLISTPPSDMLPTAEGGKANAWLRQKNAGIYVRPRLFSAYVEEAKLVLDEMMVEQSDLVRLRLVRMSNVPDALYMVNNAVPQCCHMINQQPAPGNQSTAPSVVANEIPVPSLAVVKAMIHRLQVLRHTEQVQRAYALNCGEGATVSYELQLRVLREFGLADGATELLQNPYKFFPDERFGDGSPGPALRQVGRCRVNSSPAMDSMFTDLEGLSGFRPPLPPPPPPYLPPATPSQAQLKGAWPPRVPMPTPTRSLSYPCTHTLLQRPAPGHHGNPDYPSSSRPPGPDQQMSMEPVRREFMPDIARGVSVLTLKEQHKAQRMYREDLTPMTPSAPHVPLGQGPSSRYRDHGPSCKRHAPDPKPDYPDHYDFSCGPPTSAHPPPYYTGPDLYSHSCSPSSLVPPPYLSDPQPSGHAQGWPAPDRLRLDLLDPPPLPQDAAQANPPGSLPGGGHSPRGQANETDLTRGLGHFRSSPSGNLEGYEERPSSVHREAPEEMQVAGETSGAGSLELHRDDVSEEAARERQAPSKPEYPYRKSAL